MTSSIIICTQNRASALRRTLNRLKECKLSDAGATELLLIDNGSTDDTRQVFEEADVRISKRYLFEPNPGVARARNRALREFKGDILVFLDDDIMVREQWLPALLQPIRDGSYQASLGFITFPKHILDTHLPREIYSTFAYVDETLFSHGNPKWIVTANFAMLRSALYEGLTFDVELGPGALGYNEDYLFSLQLNEKGVRIAAAPEALVEHWFEVNRLTPRSIKKNAEKMGRSLAYLHYHWHQDTPKNWMQLRLSLAKLKLFNSLFQEFLFSKFRFSGRKSLSHKIYWSRSSVAYFRQLLREKRRLPNYDQKGLVKLRGQF